MSGRPVHLFAAAIAAAVSLFSISAASAGCYVCGPSVSYSAPVVYGATVAAPVVYPAPVQYAPAPCACAAAPMYVVNQGPAYNAPVVGEADPIPVYRGGYRAYPYYAGGMRWHRHMYRGYRGARFGYRAYGPRFGYRGHAPRFAYGAHVRRYGAVVPGVVYRGGRHMHGPRAVMHAPRHPMMGMPGVHRGPRQAGNAMPHRMGGAKPGSVAPVPMPKKKP